MYIFKQAFSAKSKKTNEPFYKVELIEKRETQDKKIYFRDLESFVDKDVYDSIVNQNFNFGDIVDVEMSMPEYLGAKAKLKTLKLVAGSPYID